PPAIAGHDRLGLGEQIFGALGVAIGDNRKEGVALSESPHSARRSPAVRQPVSSTFSARAPRTRASRSSWGSDNAAPARARIASTVPVEILALKSSSASSTTSRRETRLRTESATSAACRRGPKALAII